MKARPVARRAGEGKQAIDITEDSADGKQFFGHWATPRA